MSYIDEEKIFTLESKLENDWDVQNVLVYDTYILVVANKSPVQYIPFIYNKKLVHIVHNLNYENV